MLFTWDISIQNFWKMENIKVHVHSINITRSLMKSFREIDRLSDVIFVKSPHEDLLRVFAKQNTCANLLWHFFWTMASKSSVPFHPTQSLLLVNVLVNPFRYYGSRMMENVINPRSIVSKLISSLI